MRWIVPLSAVALAVAGVALVAFGGEAPRHKRRVAPPTVAAERAPAASARPAPVHSAAPARRAGPPFAVALRWFTFVDRARGRTIVTEVRYPPRRDGPYPLLVFGHGFGLVPGDYRRLLAWWARAGYVVAAPVFPFENANAPGGPNESDLVNQPGDVSFVISRLLASSAAGTGPLGGLIDPRRVAAAGHSDGGETAVATAYDSHFRDRRVRAVVALAGAGIPGSGLETAGGPPLLAVQGTADTVHSPGLTDAFFAAAAAPKYLLRLLGAGHEPPFTVERRQLGVVERVSVAFLDRYLKVRAVPPRRIRALGTVRGVASMSAQP